MPIDYKTIHALGVVCDITRLFKIWLMGLMHEPSGVFKHQNNQENCIIQILSLMHVS